MKIEKKPTIFFGKKNGKTKGKNNVGLWPNSTMAFNEKVLASKVPEALYQSVFKRRVVNDLER